MKLNVLLFLVLSIVSCAWAQERHVITSDSVSLYVNVKGSGPACLYIHGGPGSGSYWLEKFCGDSLEKHLRIVYLDQRGTGRSASPKDGNYSMYRMVRDFEEVREALGIKSWLTLGHSFGGILQMGYIERYPAATKGMLMINCTLSMEDSFRNSWIPKACELMGISNPVPVSGDTLKLLDRFMEVIGKLTEKGLAWKMAFDSPESEKQMGATYEEIKDWNNSFAQAALGIGDYWKDYRPNTAGINAPVLFFYGKHDWSVGPEHYKGIHFPNMLLYGSDVCHIPFLENKEDLMKAVRLCIGKNYDLSN